ncbi:type IV toxin-antitoxin system AbiEi family antitoxin domain-containing protein [Microbacterium sp.]|uniref:type IV toxin-antitoxin system AbiEi family antitoxin domain-containing protein n=1 Tax=Microbacterium sp. TaxID=51671 RepID=UPI0028B04774|nr:type IV toxin-antitoxin system AbiEi family antitoxin domain-containing protein [Microbacterium sp.]
MFDPLDLLTRLGGLAQGTQLQDYGVTRMRLSRAVRSGEIERLRPGVFAAPGVAAGEREAARHGGSLTCAAALRRLGVWVMSSETAPHVWVGHRGRVYPHSGCQCVSHFFRSGRVRFGVVDVETALLHLYRCEGEESFFASLESALEQRKLTRSARARIREVLPTHAKWLVDFARADAGSGLESLLRLRLHLLGIALDCQVVIAGVGRVDFVVDGRLIIEADGKENHDGPTKRHKDLDRDAAASALGYETLHFDYAQIVHDWATVQLSIVAALQRTAQRA